VVLLTLAIFIPNAPITRKTYNYLVTFDITQSMNVDDVTLDGVAARRLTLARAGMREVLHRLPCGSKVGWSIFAGYRSFVLLLPVEVCSNYEVLLSALDRIDDRMRWANASNIAKGVYWAIRNAQAVANTDVVFFTDGQEAPPTALDTSGTSVNSDRAVRGLIIGVGGDIPARIPKTNSEGEIEGYWSSNDVIQIAGAAPGQSQEHLSALHEKYLLSLADFNGLGYERLTTPAALTRIMLDGKLAYSARAPTNVRWLFALLSLVILIWNYWPFLRARPRL